MSNSVRRTPRRTRDLIIGVDVGGTFADVICLGPHGLLVRKTPSRPDEPGADVLEGIRQIAEALASGGVRELLARTEFVFHGSTVATNALLTLGGTRVGLLTTTGFRDIVEMRGGRRESTFDSHMPNATPLAPRELRLEIPERTDRDGVVSERPRRSEVTEAADRLIAGGAGAVAITFKHSSANAENEEAAGAWAQEHLPGTFVTWSAQLSRRPRLYDRTSSTVVNAYVGPAARGYIERLGAQLVELGFDGHLLIMSGNGGVITPHEAAQAPVNLILSGPAAGPSSAALSLSGNGSDDAIVVDMGGTSFDVSILRSGVVGATTSRDVNRYRIGVPMLDIHTVGAGGGSIAWVDEVGLLKVGPASAGAVPGPAAYGLGGTEPTVTDANLLLGLLDPSATLGGARRLSRRLARRALLKVARRLGVSVPELAAGVRSVANGSMVAAVREMTVGRGLDPRGLSLIAGGGAGPLHAAEIAAELDIRTVVVPGHAGVLCAVGMASSDITYHSAVSVVRPLDEVNRPELRRRIADARRQLEGRVRALGRGVATVTSRLECEARYEGQFHELVIPVSEQELVGHGSRRLMDRFHAAHESAYGFRSDHARVEIVNVRLLASGVLSGNPRARIQRSRGGLRLAGGGTRDVILPGAPGSTPIPVLVPAPPSGRPGVDRPSKPARLRSAGPVLVDLPTTTVYVPQGWSFKLTGRSDIVLNQQRRREARA